MEREEVVRLLIELKFKSLRKFCDKADIPPSTFSNALNRGIGGMGIDTGLKMARALGVTLEDVDELSKEIDDTDPVKTVEAIKECVRRCASENKKPEPVRVDQKEKRQPV